MKFLFAISYYHPHLSGLTISAGNRAEGLVARGHSVTVIASRQRDDLPLEEEIAGVRVLRVPVRWRLNKGVIMRGYARRLREELARHEALVQFLPATPIEAWAAASAARRCAKPLILDYVCDIRLPGGWRSRLVERVALSGHRAAARAAQALIVATEDYALSSPFASSFPTKLRIVPLTMHIRRPTDEDVAALRRKLAPRGEKLIGFAGRMAAEKGIEVLIEAVEQLLRDGRHVRLLLAGEVANVIGEESYRRRILSAVEALGERCVLLGAVQPDLADFFGASDVLALPSLNRTESFGMVQAEAMLCGTPVVASDLPGVRTAVRLTGMGRIVAPGDAAGLAEALAEILDFPERFQQSPERIEAAFSAKRSLEEFERVARELLP